MPTLTFFGCALTAFGPPLALFVFTIARDPVRIIILILSAFFWLLSLLFSSVLWIAVVPLKDEPAFGLAFSVLFQEVFRLAIYFLLQKADKMLKKLTENENTQIFRNKHILSYVVGLGFGTMSGLISFVNVLADSLGPGTLGFNGEPQNFFIVSAVLCLAMILCNTAWGVIVFGALDAKRYWLVIFVWAAHYFVSFITLLNRQWLYAATIIPAYITLLISAALAFHVAGGKVQGLKNCLTLKKPTTVTVN